MNGTVNLLLHMLCVNDPSRLGVNTREQVHKALQALFDTIGASRSIFTERNTINTSIDLV